MAACGSPTGPRPAPDGLEIRPVAQVFPVQTVDGRRTVTVSAAIRNESSRTVYYSYCTERIAIEVAGEWKRLHTPVCASILVPPEPIEAGESKTLTILAMEQPGIPGLEFPFNDPNAKYRVEVNLLLKSGERFLAIEGTQSGEFAVRN
jgi:hypothetical protein